MSSKYDTKPRNPDNNNKKKLVKICSFTECCKRGEREREGGGERERSVKRAKEKCDPLKQRIGEGKVIFFFFSYLIFKRI